MACARYRAALSEHAAGGPAPARLEAHLAVCADCRSELATMRQALAIVDRELAHLAIVEPSGSFAPRIRAAAMVSRDARAPRAVWLWPSLVAAAAAAVSIILIVIQRPALEVNAVAEVDSGRPPAAAAMHEPASAPVLTGPAETGTDPRAPRRSAPRDQSGNPEVLVPPGETRALVQWVALLNRERRTPAVLGTPDGPSAHSTVPSNIEIQPIEIVPLDSLMNAGT